MTTSAARTPAREVRERATCMCGLGGACSSFAPGHALHLIQARLASATPSQWVDATVTTADTASGLITLHTLGGESHTVFSATGAAVEAPAGTPVTLHGRYHVLAIGRTLHNVAIVSPLTAG